MFFGFAKFLVASVTFGEPTSSKDYMHDVKFLNGAFGRKVGINGRCVVKPGIPLFFSKRKKRSSWLVSERCSLVQGFCYGCFILDGPVILAVDTPLAPFISIHFFCRFFEFIIVGGWLSTGDLALECQAHSLAIAEHRLIPARARNVTTQLRQAGISIVWPLPVKMSRLVVMLGLGKFVCMVHLLHFLLSPSLLSRSSFVWGEP